MEIVKKKIRKTFVKGIFLTTFILSGLLVILKFYIPNEYQFIDPISIYGTLLSSVIFVYGFILAPSISEYKESERILVDLKNSINNLYEDLIYFGLLKENGDNINVIEEELNKYIEGIYNNITDSIEYDYKGILTNIYKSLTLIEKTGVTANHIIRFKQELSNVQKTYLRIVQIKEKDSIPKIVHNLKNFITFMVVITLLFLNIGNEKSDLIGHLQESIMLFLLSFLYIYLSLIIKGLDNPFDKRRFVGYIDLSFLREYFNK